MKVICISIDTINSELTSALKWLSMLLHLDYNTPLTICCQKKWCFLFWKKCFFFWWNAFHFLCSYISFSYYYTMKKNHSEAKGNIKYLQRALCTSVLRLLAWQLLNTLWPLKLWWKIYTYFHWKSHKWNYLTICLVLTWIQLRLSL